METLQETGGGQTVLLWDGGAIVALIRQFLHRGAVQVARSQGHQSPHIIFGTSTSHVLYTVEHQNIRTQLTQCCGVGLQQES